MRLVYSFWGFNKLFKTIIQYILPENIIKFLDHKRNRDKRIIFGNRKAVISHKKNNMEGILPVLYWDRVPNFGDVIGPYLVSKITGKPVLNILHSTAPGFLTVGSILQLIDRKNMVVWGSGLIEQPTDKMIAKIKKYDPEVLSVRGKETARYLEEAGVQISNMDALGDPALIMPLFYKPTLKKSAGRVGICLHYMHKPNFLSITAEQEGIKFIDVQKDLEHVIDEICSSEVCISTSLHGLIISQAYGVPWVWLEVSDNNLKGGDFKFKDFFSTLNSSQIAHSKVALKDLESLDFQAIAAKATIPEKRYKEELILGALKERLVSLGEL